jgi:hypothetical protein
VDPQHAEVGEAVQRKLQRSLGFEAEDGHAIARLPARLEWELQRSLGLEAEDGDLATLNLTLQAQLQRSSPSNGDGRSSLQRSLGFEAEDGWAPLPSGSA